MSTGRVGYTHAADTPKWNDTLPDHDLVARMTRAARIAVPAQDEREGGRSRTGCQPRRRATPVARPRRRTGSHAHANAGLCVGETGPWPDVGVARSHLIRDGARCHRLADPHRCKMPLPPVVTQGE